ncbi:TonB-dependent receptor plug domain-containing protein [Desulfobacter vibrioformis]|uniref:TonB-dependent receptor plug domain-containing protein n=1 Tax=Desulfobacter vibrioformis TaxID=34031 RepID=UPI000A9D3460|nr:TonB-dependent receptor [Desulfobacter vibrioformis]
MLLLLLPGLFFFLPGLCPAARNPDPDLTEFSIEELMDIKVTSVNKKSQRLSDSAAAVFVITREDIRRSGATSIPDALRMAPGVNVARIDANKWAVNCRGFNSRFSPSLQVLVDGRSVYAPSFSGVYWEVTDVLLEDVDHIEVVRGPGATIWGSNAVNGVSNIITRQAHDTQGGFVQASAGSVEKNMVAARYGGSTGKDKFWRIYAKHRARDEFQRLSGEDAGDDWQTNQAGFRMDSQLSLADNFTLQGDIYDGHIHQDLYLYSQVSPYMDEFPVKTDVSGGNIMGRWTKVFSGTSEISLQMYYDAMQRSEDILNEDRHNVDAQFQHRFGLGFGNDMIWGFRLRKTYDDYSGSKVVFMDPVSTSELLYSAFIQDEISLLGDKIKLTMGSKFEHNDYTGLEIQPSTRLLWAPSEHHRVWTAISRATRIPSRMEANALIYISGRDISGIPMYSRFLNNEDQTAETLWAWEAGYRFIPQSRLFIDLALFFNDYENLRIYSPQGSAYFDAGNRILIQDIVLSNMSNARSCGAEIAVDLATSRNVKWTLAYSLTYHDYDNDGDFEIDFGFTKHQASLRGRFDLTENLTLDAWLRYVGKTNATYGISFTDNVIYEIGDYTTLDLRLGWKIRPDLEFFLIGQNLLQDSHLEFVQEAFSYPVEVPRSAYAGLTYKF